MHVHEVRMRSRTKAILFSAGYLLSLIEQWEPVFTIGTMNGCPFDCFDVKFTGVRHTKGLRTCYTKVLHWSVWKKELADNKADYKLYQSDCCRANSLLIYRLAKEQWVLMKPLYHTKDWSSSLKALSVILQFRKTTFELLTCTLTPGPTGNNALPLIKFWVISNF